MRSTIVFSSSSSYSSDEDDDNGDNIPILPNKYRKQPPPRLKAPNIIKTKISDDDDDDSDDSSEESSSDSDEIVVIHPSKSNNQIQQSQNIQKKRVSISSSTSQESTTSEDTDENKNGDKKLNDNNNNNFHYDDKKDDKKYNGNNDDNEEKNNFSKTETENDNSDNEIAPIIRLNREETTPSVTFAISRKTKSSIRGKRYFYYFYSNSKPAFCAKAKTRHPTSHIPICDGTRIHLKGKSQFTFLVGNDSTSFSLRRGESSGEELLTMKVVLDTSLLMLPRHIDIQLFQCLGGAAPAVMTTKRPKMSTRGNWILDFHNKFTIPSEKNAIFVSAADKDGPDMIAIRKISSNGMEVDLCTSLPEIAVFAIGLGIYLAKLR